MAPPPEPNNHPASENSTLETEAKSASVESVPPIVGERYVIERELGRGGMGVVYLAHDQRLHGKAVVVKVLLEKVLRDEWTVRKFQQEKEALARVDHTGIVGILDTGELPDGKPYIVMQYIEGTSLRQAIRQTREGFEFDRAASLVRQIGDALNAVHDKKVFHRDLKPENIMLQTGSQGGERVKIVDFGVAKVKDSLIAPSTRPGDVSAGTIVYMSPEQLRGDKITAASDVYSFGVIAYELVTGRRPFRPDTAAHLADMQREGVQVKPGALRPRLPEEVEELILKALSFDADARPQNAAEFGRAMAGALMNEEETARRSATPEDIQSTMTAGFINDGAVAVGNDVFISYSQADKKAANSVCQSLERAGIRCWIAPRNIPPGKTWSEFIPEAIARSRVMVLMLSAKANESKQVKKEVDIADNKGVPIIPFRIEDVPLSKALEYHLAGTQWLEAYTPPLSQHLPLLEQTVRSLIGQQTDEISVPPPRSRPWRLIAAVAVTIIVAGIIAGVWKMTGTKAARTLTYSLTVQKMKGNHEKDGPEYPATGNEPEGYGNGWAYRMNITAGQAGYLYILNEGTVSDNVLFPTQPNNNRVEANKTMVIPQPQPNASAGWYVFDANPGVERIRIIFSAEPLSELDTTIRAALNNAANTRTKAITDPAQVKTVREVVARYGNTAPTVDEKSRQSVINGSGNVVTSLLELNHKSQ